MSVKTWENHLLTKKNSQNSLLWSIFFLVFVFFFSIIVLCKSDAKMNRERPALCPGPSEQFAGALWIPCRLIYVKEHSGIFSMFGNWKINEYSIVHIPAPGCLEPTQERSKACNGTALQSVTPSAPLTVPTATASLHASSLNYRATAAG